MSIDKKTKAEVLKVYDTWLYSYLNGDVATYNSYLDDAFHFIGSTVFEEFLNRKDTTRFFEATAEQLSGKSQVRNETKVVEQFDDLIFITHLFDAWFLAGDDWTFYSRFRFTNALQKKKEGWKFIYQHYSTPDTKAQEGETIGYDQVSAENLQLREAIQRRTKELENKNRELKIEGALQRIRAEAVAMKESSDLMDIVVTMRTEFTRLGHEAHYFWHMMWLPSTYEKAMTSGDGTKIGFVMELPRHIHGDIPLLANWEKNKNPLVIYPMDAEEAIAYVDKMVHLGDFKNIDPQAPSHDDIRHINGLTFIMARTTHGEIGYSLPGKVENPPAEDLELLKQFAGAFDLAHRRFLDLQKAEKQAREVRIELALEKVRSRSMAMHTSEELKEAGALLYQELSKLGIQNLITGYVLFDETATMGWNYGVNPMDGSIRPEPVGMNHTTTKVMKAIASSWKKQDPLLVIQLNEEETIKHQTFIADESIGFPISKEKLLSISPERLVVHTFNFKQGYLLIVGGVLLTIEQQEMITRFANVFQQTYTRFLDLQKAEAQARESQIELALERVRARTMAMQDSEELKEVIQTVYEQFVALNINIEHTGFIIDYKKNDMMHIWLADKNEIATEILLPYFDSAHWNSFKEAKAKGENFFTNLLSLKEKNKFYKDLFKLIPNVPEGLLKTYLEYPGLAISTVLLDNVGLYIENFDGIPYTKKENDTLMRFGKVFQQTYTRFQDLQKAEAQYREAQIETALEKVRSRSMAMQQSDEIGNVAMVLYEQLTSLGGALWGTGFGFCEEKAATDEYWFVNERGVMPPLKIPHTKDPTHKAMYKGWRDNLEILTIAKGGTELEKHYNYMLSVPDVQPVFQGMLDSGISFPTWQKWHAAYFKFGYLLVITTEPYEDEEIFIRFAKVFEQSYTRFLDLQKAEAQARKAQIEASLERVRSRGMAMHTSDELREAGDILFEEITKLGIESISSGYVIFEEDENIGWNYAPNPSTGKIMPIATGVYHKETDIMRSIHKNWKKQKPAYLVEMDNKQTITHQTFIAERSINFPLSAKELIAASPPELKIHCFNFEQGYLMNLGGTKLTEDQIEIMLRFTKVFQQTYTRFLDLQKAEAQAREAQIEVSLERVRSRAMAMRQSEDLVSCTRIVFDELEKLNLSIERSGIGIFDPATKDCQLWTTVVATDGTKELATGVTSLTVHPMLTETFIAWENQKPYSYILEGKELEDYYTLVTKSKFVLSEELIEKSAALPKEYYHYSPFGAGGLYFFSNSEPFDEDKQIIHRFAEVFDLTYTRFLDLQKSEAQAREAQIEAALEKVRSRSLAMQKPEELQEVVAVVAEKLKDLGVIFDAGGVILCTYFPDNKDMLHWIAVDDFSTSGRYFLPYFDTPILSEAWDSKIRGDAYFSKEFSVEAKNHFFEYAFEHSDYKHFPEDYKQHVLQAGMHRLSAAWSKNSAILIPSLTGAVPSESDAEIMTRFAKVFEQAYIRFMDLQKAEEQAHEAQIEASLEKVRTVALTLTKSDEMLDIAQVLYEQLLSLGFKDIRNAIIDIHNDATETFLDYDYSHDMSSAVTEFSFYGDPIIEQQIKKTQSANDAFFEIELKGKQLEELIETRLRNGEKDDPRLRKIDHLTYNLYSFGNGAIGISNFGILSDAQKIILKRFRNVFTFAYKRYTDLANAEAQAREAKIEAALERVRSVALSMVESTDLLHIVKALYEQLVELGFSDIRNALIDVNNEDEETFLDYDYSEEMGGTVTLMSYDDDPTLDEQVKVIAATTDGFSEMVLEGQQLQDLIDMRRKNGEADDPRLLKTDSVAYILYAFGNGAVGISNFGLLSKDQKNILDRFRNVFTFAYQRFKDLQVREEQSAKLLDEKIRLEKTLTDLQQTQKQLIQSEKMASLGELTAGIAHEIQNPLNFVNNFSEVSNELIDEMNEEIEKGDLEEAKLIANDIKQNLEKINHHGKRADAIVKGMLQHSRKSTAEKVPTDINKLADEYLRLAYHGLRAKDKSFNATLETDFDESIGKVKVIPQDMGRVILNLITNAFYATNERKKVLLAPEGGIKYVPTVSISTRKNPPSGGRGDSVTISIKDNGNGIPKHVIDKIYQPFFTTKPTGEGTGLGLSMSYDIVTKGHGGELKVETKENEGTTFTIYVPL
ncbi:ATP-binding protein [Rasiella sp. SM2506]|uniref:ATP-binding protein n=1 Tax=Rasiella sp. SM2506 TaxID=3423914 RepID=UPI003D7B8821